MNIQGPSEPADDDEVEQITHSFVLKIWRERVARTGQRATWRGRITHIPGNEETSVKHMDEIMDFIAPYVEQLGVQLGSWWQFARWRLRRRRSRCR